MLSASTAILSRAAFSIGESKDCRSVGIRFTPIACTLPE